MEITRMRIVALLLYSIAISKVCLVNAVSTPFDTSNLCKGDWTYSYGSCYSPKQQSYINATEAQEYCKFMDEDSYLLVLNTKQEIITGIENGAFSNGETVCQGMITDNNGTTFTKLDGSSEETYIETLRPYLDASGGNAGRVCCDIYWDLNADFCSIYSDAWTEWFYCEKPGPYINSGPCDIKINRKPRKGATRKFSFKNTEQDMCYIELSSRSHFRPAQIKIYGYNFPSTSRTCSQGFFVQNNGKVLDYLHQEKLTCGSDGGPNGPLIKKRSGRGDKIRVYVAMNGDGRRVWLRTKGRNFRN